MSAHKRTDTYQRITDEIVRQLEAGAAPWQKPWDAELGAPCNVEGRFYQGVNVWLLAHAPYSDPRWTTFNMAKRHGG